MCGSHSAGSMLWALEPSECIEEAGSRRDGSRCIEEAGSRRGGRLSIEGDTRRPFLVENNTARWGAGGVAIGSHCEGVHVWMLVRVDLGLVPAEVVRANGRWTSVPTVEEDPCRQPHR